jgi:hypothetical protein
MHLVNTSRLKVIGHYGGIPYILEPGQRMTVKNVRVQDRKTGGTFETHMAEDVAAKLFSDLQQRGVVLIDDENPFTEEQYQEMGRDAQIAFILSLIDDFNSLNAEIASGSGRKILQVPRHYKELQKELARLIKERDGEAPTTDVFTTEADLQKLRARTEGGRTEAINRVMEAVASGDIEAAQAAANSVKTTLSGDDPPAMLGDTDEGEFLDTGTMPIINVPRKKGKHRP